MRLSAGALGERGGAPVRVCGITSDKEIARGKFATNPALSGGTTPRWVNLVFACIWLVTALVFLSLALYNAQVATSTSLARFSVDNPQWVRVRIEGIDFGQTLNELTQANNKNVQALEDSIRQGAVLSSLLNFVSCGAAVAGFVAQVTQYRYQQRN